MNLSRILLSLGIISILLAGCQERGISLPPPKTKPKPKLKTNEYDYPLIKLIARALPSSEESDADISTKSTNSVDKVSIKEKQLHDEELENTHRDPIINQEKNISINIPSKASFGIFDFLFKQDSEENSNIELPTQATKKKPLVKNRLDQSNQKPTTTKNRPTKQRSRLIFNKNTSFREIPLPLPKLSSLKLKSLIKSLPTIPLRKIPILNSLLPEGSKVAQGRLKRKKSSIISSAAGAEQNTDDTLDMANIRIGVSNDYTALIFDSYLWAGYNNTPTEISDTSGKYEFDHDIDNNQIVVRIEGYSAFSALLGDQSELFKESKLVKGIYLDRYIGKKSIQFIIKLRKKVKVTVVNMTSPGRIIVNLYPVN